LYSSGVTAHPTRNRQTNIPNAENILLNISLLQTHIITHLPYQIRPGKHTHLYPKYRLNLRAHNNLLNENHLEWPE
jgi:hypothetical protein